MHEIYLLIWLPATETVNYSAVKNAFFSILSSNKRFAPTHPSSFTSESKWWMCNFHTGSLYLPSDLAKCVHVQNCGTVRQPRGTDSSRLFFFLNCVITHCCLSFLAFTYHCSKHTGRITDDSIHAETET